MQKVWGRKSWMHICPRCRRHQATKDRKLSSRQLRGLPKSISNIYLPNQWGDRNSRDVSAVLWNILDKARCFPGLWCLNVPLMHVYNILDFCLSSSAYCRHPHIRPQADIPLPTEERIGTGFHSQHYRDASFSGLDGSSWLNSAQPEYSSHPIMVHMAPPHVNQGQPHPSTRYSYSPPSDPSYSQETYDANQQPRLGININTHSYYTSEDTMYEPQNSQHRYYLPNGHYQRFHSQQNDFPTYSDLHVGPQHDNKWAFRETTLLSDNDD